MPDRSRHPRRRRLAGDGRGRGQTGDLVRDGGRGVSTGLLPPLLRGHRAVGHKIVGGPCDVARVEGRVELAGLPGQDDGEGGFVQLHVGLVGSAVDRRVLREMPVRELLPGEQPVHRACGRGVVSGREQGADLLVFVASPDEVVAVAAASGPGGVDRLPPGKRQRCDEGAPLGLVLVGLDGHHRGQVLAGECVAEPGGDRFELAQGGLPAVLVGGPGQREWGSGADRGDPFRLAGGRAEADRQRQGGAPPADGDLCNLADVPGPGLRVGGVESVVRGQVQPRIGRSADIPAWRSA